VTTYPAFPELSRAFSLKQSEDPVDPTIRDSYENGMESARARFTRRRRTFSMTIDLLGEADRLALDAFYTSMVEGAGAGFGSLAFNVTDPRYIITPQTYLVRFASMPKYMDAGWIGADAETPAGFRWNVSFQVREV
jgi:hypothetical protein